jgi:transposase-like protein
MSKRSRYSAEEKYEILRLFDDGLKSGKEILDEFGVHNRTLQDWRYQFLDRGIEGLVESKSINGYSKELKIQVVNEVLSGAISLRAAARKYGILDKSTIRMWLKKYNDHREIK